MTAASRTGNGGVACAPSADSATAGDNSGMHDTAEKDESTAHDMQI